MPDNTNPQAVLFANDKVRIFANHMLSSIETARRFDALYGAQSGDALFPNDADLIADGSQIDGRPRIQNQVVRALRTVASDLLVWAATGNPTRETRLRSIASAGESKF